MRSLSPPAGRGLGEGQHRARKHAPHPLASLTTSPRKNGER